LKKALVYGWWVNTGRNFSLVSLDEEIKPLEVRRFPAAASVRTTNLENGL
jgi:hypothetical protein